MNWNILQRWNFFHFWWKISHCGEKNSSASGPSRLPTFGQNMQSGNFSTLVDNFPLSKSWNFFQNYMNQNIQQRKVSSQRSENFPLLKIYLFGPTTGQSLSKIIFLQKNWHPSRLMFRKNSQFSNLNQIFFKFSDKSHYFRKFGNFIYLRLQVCQVPAKSKKLFSLSSSFLIIIIIHHD